MNVPAQRAAPDRLLAQGSGSWEVVVGMEVHAQVSSNAKLFSAASTAFGAEPNAHVSLLDAAMPGMLPVINEECVRQAVRTGLAFGAQINLRSVLDRKNYFYPDLPQGYQITQYSRHRWSRRDRRRPASWLQHQSWDRSYPSRTGRGQVIARPVSRDVPGRPQPQRHRADGDCFAARPAFG